MSSNYHTPFTPAVTKLRSSSFNTVFGDLDSAITTAFSDIANHTHDVLFSSGPYDVLGSFSGSPTASQVVARVPFARDVTFPVGLTASQMVAGVAATAETIFSLKKNGGAAFGTATFAASGTIAVLASGAGAYFTEGDVLTIEGPASPDATLADLGWCISGTREAVTTSTTSTTTSTTSTTTSTTSTTTSTTSSTTTTTYSTTSTTSSTTTSTTSTTSSTTTTTTA